MAPPINIWHSHPRIEDCEKSNTIVQKSVNHNKKCISFRLVGTFRVAYLNAAFVMLLLQLTLHLNTVKAGPVVSLDHFQGSMPLARNIRHLPCISRKTSQEGLCMFAIDCLKANGTHLGTCIDRFYFGSCCQIPDKTILPQIIGNNIEDNAIDGAEFVHPQTEDTIESTVSKIPDHIFPIRKPTTTQKVTVETTTSTEKLVTIVSDDLEHKSNDGTTLDNKIPDEDTKITTAIVIETTTKIKPTTVTETTTKSKPTTNNHKVTQKSTTEIPIKLSTFQSVSGVTGEPTDRTTNDGNKEAVTKPVLSQQDVSTTTSTQASVTQQSHKKPTRPSYKPRPSNKPTNFTRPHPISTTIKPKPVGSNSIYNSTRLPYRPPPKRPSTKRPIPIPPRLNITIIPQSTSKPPFTKPSTVSITYINNTSTTIKDTPVLTKYTTTTTPSTTITTTTIAPSSTETQPLPTTTLKVTVSSTVKLPETTPYSNEISTEKSIDKNTSSSTQSEGTTLASTEQTFTSSPISTSEISLTIPAMFENITTPQEIVSEKETLKPTTEGEILSTPSSTTEFPPLVTWSSTIGVTTKSPENVTLKEQEESWSPIPPPEGWILISTVSPKPDNSTAKLNTTTTTTTTEIPSTINIETTDSFLPTLTETVIQETETTTYKSLSEATTKKTSPTSTLTTQTPISTTTLTTSTTEKATSVPVMSTETPLMEFVVNVTLSPTEPTTTTGMGLSTFTSVTIENTTQAAAAISNATETMGLTITEPTSITTVNTTTVTEGTTPKPLNMSNFKEVCGRRLWPEARIVGGNKSAFGMWPWQISLRQYRTSTYLHKCGAALLNENWAITAAHCVEHVPPSELLIRLGEHDLANEQEPYGFAERRVQLVASHPHFDPATFEYDLALLRFVEPVTFQPNILPVCIPDDDDNYVGRTAHVTGWGRLYDEGPLPSVLQQVEVPVINNTACEGMYQMAGYNEHIPNIFICAGWAKGGADSCEGDSGGPMVIPRKRDGRFVLSGIISWGIGCAEPNQPGVYTRISEFRDWINQILQF